MAEKLILLDGPMGTELEARGVSIPLPAWTASAVATAPEVVAQIHRDYAAAGATVHTAATFRTRRRQRPDDWEELTRRAVEIARAAVPPEHRVAGSLAPIEDCYRPDLSPPDPRPEHREMALALATARVDLILCETFPHAGEAAVAVVEAAATGIETWAALTAGPDGSLMTPEELEQAARACFERGATCVLVNCVGANKTLPYVQRLAGIGRPCGAYANVIGSTDPRPARYAEHARAWVLAGARVIGACCGAGPKHIEALRKLRREMGGQKRPARQGSGTTSGQ